MVFLFLLPNKRWIRIPTIEYLYKVVTKRRKFPFEFLQSTILVQTHRHDTLSNSTSKLRNVVLIRSPGFNLVASMWYILNTVKPTILYTNYSTCTLNITCVSIYFCYVSVWELLKLYSTCWNYQIPDHPLAVRVVRIEPWVAWRGQTSIAIRQQASRKRFWHFPKRNISNIANH